LPPNDPNRKFKGRVVFQGNRVQDESRNAALFQELGSSPATMEAGKACDAYGLAPGHDVEQADAEQAYIQRRLGGDTPTWVRLPRERQPASWGKYRDPVCPLVLALYGRPDPGGYWERHCHKHLVAQGFSEVPSWRSCYVHPRLRLFLVVYVDDFKLAGPRKGLAEGWRLIRKEVRTEDPIPLGKYLGCNHVMSDRTMDLSLPANAPFVWPIPRPDKSNDQAFPGSARGGDGATEPKTPRGGGSSRGGATEPKTPRGVAPRGATRGAPMIASP